MFSLVIQLSTTIYFQVIIILNNFTKIFINFLKNILINLVINPHCYISYSVPNSMNYFSIRFYFDNMVFTYDGTLTACVTMELNMNELYSFSRSLGNYQMQKFLILFLINLRFFRLFYTI